MCNALRLMALTIIVALVNSATAQNQPTKETTGSLEYTITDLGWDVIPAQIAAINNRGQVTGSADPCPTCTAPPQNYQAMFWSESTGVLNLGGPTNNNLGGSSGWALNNRGEITGTSNNPNLPFYCCNAYIWHANGEVQDLGTPPGCTAVGVGINDREEVVGTTGEYYFGGTAPCFPFYWNEKDGMKEMPLPPGALSLGVAGINDRGVVVGAYEASDSSTRSFFWTKREGYRDLGVPQVRALAMNNQDHVVGQLYSCTPCNPDGHAFLWDREHGVIDLGVLPGQTNSAAQAVNSRDEVVGYSALFFTGAYPFLWTRRTGMVNLNTLIDSSSGWVLIDASGINDKGQITGFGTLNGQQHGFVLTPKDCF